MHSNAAAEAVSNSGEVPRLITGAQIRAGRALMRWSAEELAHRCGLSAATIARVEATNAIPGMTAANLMKIKSVLEEGGVEFLDNGGVRLR
jgi:transcriptional regulator with XRE-family HTH domain